MPSRSELYANTLSKLVRKETISFEGQTDKTKFYEFQTLLRETFPHIFAACTAEDFNGSLLLLWKGKTDKDPLLLMHHHDVVEAQGEWKYPPFAGTIAENKVWGRGALDTKGGLWAMLTAADELAREGFVPDRDIYFESACNEETDGAGADAISRELWHRGIHFYMTLDEGGMMMREPIAGATGVYAMVGVGEKGCADLKFIARSAGGHASTPGKNTPLVRLGKFMADAESSGIFKVALPDVIAEMFRRLSPGIDGALGKILAKPEKFRLLLKTAMPAVSATAGAMLKTTLAFTMAQGSEGYNVLPQEAYVTGNMRFSHHQGGQASIAAVTKLAKKYDIETEVLDPGFESAVSDYNSDAFKLVESAVAELFPGVITTPYIMTGASDSRFFSRVSDNCLRFAPFLIDDQQLESIHGLNENVDISALEGAVDFYKYIIREV